MSSIPDEINPNALLYTLAKQKKPLPPAFQKSFTELTKALKASPTRENKVQLLKLIKEYDSLAAEYQNTLEKIVENYNSQERMKGSDVILMPSISLDILSLLSSEDPVRSAKQVINNLTSSHFADRGDRLVTLASGGAFLGVLFLQVPGAIVGALIGGFFAWFSTRTAGKKN